MSDLLSIGKSGVIAYQNALAGISENVVNANNDGFARRKVTLSEQMTAAGPMFAYRTSSAFNGVQAADVSRVWDQFRAQKAWSANSDSSQASTRSQWFANVETAMDDGETGVGTKLTAIFTTANALAANPANATQRQSFLYAIQDAAGAINGTASNLQKIAGSVASQATDAVGQVNDALGALARVNLTLKTAPQGSTGRAALEDQRDTLIGKISDKVGTDVTLDGTGAATIRLGNTGGPVLLDADSIAPAQLNLHVNTVGQLSTTVSGGGSAAPVNVSSGALAGLAEAANQISDRRQQLDALAANLAQQLNSWNKQGKDANGNPGADLVTGTDAASLALAVTNTDLVAAADANSAGGNMVAIASLRGSNGAENAWRVMVTDQGLRVQSAKGLETSASAAKDSAYSDLDDVSGVDLDAEAADLLRYQQAYSASAKIIQTARQTLQAVFDLF